MIDLFGLSDMWGAIDAITARVKVVETALKQVIEDGPKFSRAVNNEARISLLEERFNTLAQEIRDSATVRVPPTEMPGQLVAVPDTRNT